MRYLSWLFGFVLFLLALGFAVKNSDTVVVHYYLGYQWQASLVLVMLVFFVAVLRSGWRPAWATYSGSDARSFSSSGKCGPGRRRIKVMRNE